LLLARPLRGLGRNQNFIRIFEIKKRCGKLMHKAGDILEPFEVKKIRDKLLKYFE